MRRKLAAVWGMPVFDRPIGTPPAPAAGGWGFSNIDAPLNRGCGGSGFVTIDPGDARFVTRPAADEKASQWEDSYDD
jgi:hypothetical protein